MSSNAKAGAGAHPAVVGGREVMVSECTGGGEGEKGRAAQRGGPAEC